MWLCRRMVNAATPDLLRLVDGHTSRLFGHHEAEAPVSVNDGGSRRLAQHLKGRARNDVPAVNALAILGYMDTTVGVMPHQVRLDLVSGYDFGLVGRRPLGLVNGGRGFVQVFGSERGHERASVGLLAWMNRMQGIVAGNGRLAGIRFVSHRAGQIAEPVARNSQTILDPAMPVTIRRVRRCDPIAKQKGPQSRITSKIPSHRIFLQSHSRISTSSSPKSVVDRR